MKLTIAPTPHFFLAGDVMVRLWTGTADDGSDVVVFVTAVGFAGQAEALSEGLVSIPPPDEEAAQRWAKQIMAGQADHGAAQ